NRNNVQCDRDNIQCERDNIRHIDHTADISLEYHQEDYFQSIEIFCAQTFPENDQATGVGRIHCTSGPQSEGSSQCVSEPQSQDTAEGPGRFCKRYSDDCTDTHQQT
ncbi:hypothetical protein OTU49_004693, partial [Cherax quadricarinatus]